MFFCFFWDTLPETNISPLKMDGWKTFSFPFWVCPIFSGVCCWFWGGEISSNSLMLLCSTFRLTAKSSTAWEQSCKSPGKMKIAGTLTIWRCISCLNNDHFPWPCYFTSTSVPQEIEKSVVFPVWTLIPIWVSQMSRDHLIISPYLTWFLHVAAGGSKTTQLHKDIHSSKLT